MKRPTIHQIAATAGVSVASVNRYLAGAHSLRKGTRTRIDAAMRTIDLNRHFRTMPEVNGSKQTWRLGFVLPPQEELYGRFLAEAIRLAASQMPFADFDLRIEHIEKKASSREAAELVREMSEECDAISVTAALHPSLTQEIEESIARNIRILATGIPLNESGELEYIGIDHWKMGRTAAWTFDKLGMTHGTIGIILGRPRYLDQEMNESGFRSYFREFHGQSTTFQTCLTHNSVDLAKELTETLLSTHRNLNGIYVVGGPLRGVLSAVGESSRCREVTVVSCDALQNAKAALLNGGVAINFAPPFRQIADEAILKLLSHIDKRHEVRCSARLLFETITPENL